jgi:predicted permease
MQALRDVATDSVFALRSFRRSPGWTFVTLLTIALGVGASTAVFSVADTFLVRPIAYRDASRVYVASLEGRLQNEALLLPLSAAVVRQWRQNARTVDATAPFEMGPGAFLHGDLEPVRIASVLIDTSFLAFTGARPVIGRNFTTEEITPNGPHAILLSEGFWRRQFGGSPDVLGKVVRLDLGGEPEPRLSTIVGVLPASLVVPDFEFERPDVWLPIIHHPRARTRQVAVRLTPDASPEAAAAELTAILERDGGIEPGDRVLQPSLRVSRPQDQLPFRQALTLLMAAVMLLLLIACSNISHLLLQRGIARERELAVRHAIGADRARLIRQLVTESALLAAIGGALAMAVGWGTLTVLGALRPSSLPALAHLSSTRAVLPIAAGLTIVVGLAVGVLGALHVAHKHLGQSLRTGASSAPVTHRRLRGTLVIGQIALSAILLVGAIVLIRAVSEFRRVELGFDPRGLYEISFGNRNPNAVPSPESQTAFANTVRELGTQRFGGRNLTIASGALPGDRAFASAFETRERPGVVGPTGTTGVHYVGPDYFSVLRTPLRAGRAFDDASASRAEVIVNRALARQLGFGGNPIGQQFRNSRREGAFQEWHTVVGVAPDILTSRLDRAPQTVLYRPFADNAVGASLIVRLPQHDAMAVARRFAGSVQPDPLTWRVIDVNGSVEQTIAEPRFTMTILVLFAASGVVLAAIGLFGVVSYTLGARTREIGVRITLGATRRNIAGLFVRDALGQAALGTAIGLAGAAALTRLTQVSFYGVASLDTTTFIVAAGAMLMVSMGACAGPLIRATRVDPVVAIRAD